MTTCAPSINNSDAIGSLVTGSNIGEGGNFAKTFRYRSGDTRKVTYCAYVRWIVDDVAVSGQRHTFPRDPAPLTQPCPTGYGCASARPWNARIAGFWIRPSWISMARLIVSLTAHAPGPDNTVSTNGISASLFSQVAEFHR